MAATRATKIELDQSYTVEEFERLPEFGDRYELIDGKLVKKAVPGGEHARIARLILKHYDLFDYDENE